VGEHMDAWIYVVLLGLLIISFAWLKPKKDEGATIGQIELILDQFIDDMEAENKKWLLRLEEQRNEWKKENSLLRERIVQLEAKLSIISTQAISKQQEVSEVASTVTEDVQPATVEEPPSLELQNRYKPIFDLVKTGKSVSFIAKQTGMNHGEIELILQLAKQGGAYES
jgi:hypothetical protein